MNFVHPELLYLAPFVSIPILIHLLNRIRYRRVQWAAIDFLLMSERRAVRRAKLRQLILMALRTLLLAAALGALLQPILGGGLAALMGGSSQVAVVVDASASMSGADASGRAFDTAKKLAKDTLPSVSSNATVTGGTFSVRYQSPFRQPLRDRRAVASVIESAKLTGGSGDIPQAIRGAAESLARGGGGGTIWLLTDLRASGWRMADTGTWQQVRAALEEAGKPRLVITDLGPKIDANFSIAGIRTTPAVLIENDTPKLTATVQLHGESAGVTSVALFFEGRRLDRRVLQVAKPGKTEVVFDLPKLTTGSHAGYLELDPDAVPADDRHYFILRVTGRIPVLIVDGSPSVAPWEGAADFLALAVQPPVSDPGTRSPFTAKVITAEQLAGTQVKNFAAVLLADVPGLEPRAAKQLKDYVGGGGMLMVFPGEHTDIAAWNDLGFPGPPIKTVTEAKAGKPIVVNWTSPTSPITATLPVEGLDRLTIKRIVRYEGGNGNDGEEKGQVLATVEGGDSFLVSLQHGAGKIYVFGVSAQGDFSNLPFTPVLLLTVHRSIIAHLMDVAEPPSREAFAELDLTLPPGRHQVLTPDESLLPVTTGGGSAGKVFRQTGLAGIYRLIEGDTPPENTEEAPLLAAINVPRDESALDRIGTRTIQTLLPGYPAQVMRVSGGEQLSEGTGARSAASSFPLATLAMILLLGEVVFAWRVGLPAQDD